MVVDHPSYDTEKRNTAYRQFQQKEEEIIWDALCNLKSVKNTHSCNFTLSNTSPWVILMFFEYTNGTKSRKV